MGQDGEIGVSSGSAGSGCGSATRTTARCKNRLVPIYLSGHKLDGTRPDGGVKSDSKGNRRGGKKRRLDESAPARKRAKSGRREKSGKRKVDRRKAGGYGVVGLLLRAERAGVSIHRSSIKCAAEECAARGTRCIYTRPSPVAPSGLRDAGIECVARRCHNSPSRSAPALIEPYCRHFSWRAAGMVAAVHPCC